MIIRASNTLAKILQHIVVIYGGMKMTCPKCYEKTKVIDSTTDEDSTTRRRECVACGCRFSTIEIDKDMYERLVKNHEKQR